MSEANTHEKFNLDRKISMDNMIDPTGRKWDVKGERGSSLVHARPNPDRADALIPVQFKGRWTSPTVLREKIETWLNQQWDKSEAETLRRSQRAGIVELQQKQETKQTPEESLAELPDEIKEVLGDIIAVVEEPECQVELAQMKMDQLREIATPLGVKGTSKSALIEGINAKSK